MKWIVDFLILLIFLSKVSFQNFLPSQFSYFVLQHGLHPWMNLGFHLLIAIPLFLQFLRIPEKIELCRQYLTLILALAVVLVLVTVAQAAFTERAEWLVSLGSLFFACLLIFFYGALLPQMHPVDFYIGRIFFWSTVCVMLSMLLLLGAPEMAYKGGRFIGIFKHIPYMVTTASLGIFTSLFYLGRVSAQLKPVFLFTFCTAVAALLFTGTRSATMVCLVLTIFYGFKFFGQLQLPRTLAWGFAGVLTIALGYFTGDLLTMGQDVVQGKSSFMSREAQDGIQDRFSEIERGMQNIKSPWVGEGLGFKFANVADGPEADLKYSSFNDPHNYFISAMIVGGYPLLLICCVFLLYLGFKSSKGLYETIQGTGPLTGRDLIHLYVFLSLPILIIYHVHLSIGGMADRVYWLAFGLMAQGIPGTFYNKSAPGYRTVKI